MGCCLDTFLDALLAKFAGLFLGVFGDGFEGLFLGAFGDGFEGRCLDAVGVGLSAADLALETGRFLLVAGIGLSTSSALRLLRRVLGCVGEDDSGMIKCAHRIARKGS